MRLATRDDYDPPMDPPEGEMVIEDDPNPYVSADLREAWEEGRQAAVRGKSISACPYLWSGASGASRPLTVAIRRLAWYEGHAVGVKQADG
jgi:ribosome modulation factor